MGHRSTRWRQGYGLRGVGRQGERALSHEETARPGEDNAQGLDLRPVIRAGADDPETAATEPE